MIDDGRVEDVIAALGEVLSERGADFAVAVVGGAGLLLQGLIRRSTRDVDVVAVLVGGELQDPRPLPPPLLDAAADVARTYELQDGWLNSHAADLLLEYGLPDDFIARCEVRRYGGLTVHLASRQDQIAFKLFASLDVNRTRDVDDLRAIHPTEDELITAAPWVLGRQLRRFRTDLVYRLTTLGVEDAESKVQ